MITTIWGSSGSGKSMLACLLARRLMDGGQNVIVINPDTDCPMLPVWQPRQTAPAGTSLGTVLATKEIDKALVAQQVVIHKAYPSIGFLGYSPKDVETIEPYTTSAMSSVIRLSTELVDHVVLDCTGGVRDKFTAVALLMADMLLQVLTPDTKGGSFVRAQWPILSKTSPPARKQYIFAGMARPFHDFDAAGGKAGGFNALLPYGKEMERAAASGGLCEAYGFMNTRYTEALDMALEDMALGSGM